MADFDPIGDYEEQEERRKKAEHDARLSAQIEHDDLRWMLSTKRGRRILGRLLDSTCHNLPSFDTAASAMSWKEGRRYVGLELSKKLKATSPDNYYLLLQENNL